MPVFQHPNHKMRLLLHDVEVLGRRGVDVGHGEAEGVRLDVRVAAGLALDGDNVGRPLGGVQDDAAVLPLVVNDCVH